jgi:hypothetical protein
MGASRSSVGDARTCSFSRNCVNADSYGRDEMDASGSCSDDARTCSLRVDADVSMRDEEVDASASYSDDDDVSPSCSDDVDADSDLYRRDEADVCLPPNDVLPVRGCENTDSDSESRCVAEERDDTYPPSDDDVVWRVLVE